MRDGNTNLTLPMEDLFGVPLLSGLPTIRMPMVLSCIIEIMELNLTSATPYGGGDL
jgi:hypothetical protein